MKEDTFAMAIKNFMATVPHNKLAESQMQMLIDQPEWIDEYIKIFRSDLLKSAEEMGDVDNRRILENLAKSMQDIHAYVKDNSEAKEILQEKLLEIRKKRIAVGFARKVEEERANATAASCNIL